MRAGVVMVLCVLAPAASAQQTNCALPLARKCAAKYAEAYGCHVTSVSLPPEDGCAEFMQASSACLLETCSQCNCTAAVEPFTPCEKKHCAPHPDTCSPGCKTADIANGVCNGFCMTSACDFDGGDCLVNSWHNTLLLKISTPDSNGSATVGRCESSAGNGVEELALATYDDVSFGLGAHPRVDALKAALYIVRSADADLDGSLSYEEARGSYQLTWDEYAWVKSESHGAKLEAPAISSMIFDITETLRGKPWADRDTFHGADVAAAAAIKMLSRCDSTQIDATEARVIGLGPAGFGWGDVDANGALGVDELLQILKKVG
jgi:hypothetical protein